jgi:hypothetical protein
LAVSPTFSPVEEHKDGKEMLAKHAQINAILNNVRETACRPTLRGSDAVGVH